MPKLPEDQRGLNYDCVSAKMPLTKKTFAVFMLFIIEHLGKAKYVNYFYC